jgi:hypothetical protein
LQILLLGKSWQRTAADRQRSDGKYCALHATPRILMVFSAYPIEFLFPHRVMCTRQFAFGSGI